MDERENVIFGKVITLLKKEYQPEFDKRGFGKVELDFCRESLRKLVDDMDERVILQNNQEAIRQILYTKSTF